MNTEKAAIMIWEAARKALGSDLEHALKEQAVDYISGWPIGSTLKGEYRGNLLLSRQDEFDDLVGNLIPRATQKIREVARKACTHRGELTTEDCQLLEDYLSWLSARSREKPLFLRW